MTLLLRNISKIQFPQQTLRLCPLILSSKSPFNITSHVLTKNSISISSLRHVSTKQPEKNKQPTLRQKLKKAVAEYGSTVIIFHVSISLVSLGVCYLLVSSGLDVGKFMVSLGISGETANKVATNAGTFAVAYALHKVFAPVRIMTTLTATPFIVRYLRQVGILKKPIK